MNTKPRVSVCVPTYNYAQFLPPAVESVLSQSFEDFELIVIDDGSSDNTVQVMQAYTDDPRVTFVAREKNVGLFANFNDCAERARGEYVKYLCADDWLEPQMLERSVALLDAHPEVTMTTTANWMVDVNGMRIGAEQPDFGPAGRVAAGHAIDELAIGHNVIGMPTNTLVRRADLLAVGAFDATFAPAADVDLWLKLLARGDLGWVPERLTSTRIHDTHTHDYGSDPNTSLIRVWRHAADTSEGYAVTRRQAARAVANETGRFAWIALKYLLGGQREKAGGLLRAIREYASWPQIALRFVTTAPWIVRARLVTSRAQRKGLPLVYTPRPRIDS